MLEEGKAKRHDIAITLKISQAKRHTLQIGFHTVTKILTTAGRNPSKPNVQELLHTENSIYIRDHLSKNRQR